MTHWWNRLRYLWEEESPPLEQTPRGGREEPVGTPRALRRATRFSLTAVLATSLMGQVIGVRLIAPVDASEQYDAQCIKACADQATGCVKGCLPNKKVDQHTIDSYLAGNSVGIDGAAIAQCVVGCVQKLKPCIKGCLKQ